MAESATSTTVSSVLRECGDELPDQLNGQKHFIELDGLYNYEKLFALLCNVSLFGVPLFNCLLSANCADEYVKSRRSVIEWLKVIRCDLRSPILAFKAKRLQRIRKSINSLSDKASPSSTVKWYFELLTLEAGMLMAQQRADFERVKTFEQYEKNTGKRIYEYNFEEFENAGSHTLENQYWNQLTKLSDSLRRKQSNKELIALTLGDCIHAVFADAAINTGGLHMMALFHEDEQDFLAEQFGINNRTELSDPLSKDTLKLIRTMSPSRLKPDATLGQPSYSAAPHLSELDWIDTEVTDIDKYLAPPNSLHDELHSHSNATDSEFEDEIERVFTNTPERQRRDTGTTVVSSPPPIINLKTPEPAKRWNPEPMDTSRLGIREREKAHLLNREKKLLTVTKPKTEEGTKSTPPEPQPASSDEVNTRPPSPRPEGMLHYAISEDSCQHLLELMKARFRNSSIPGTDPNDKAAHLELHNHRFGIHGSIATQIVARMIRQSDRILQLCESGDSIRYTVTFSPDSNAVLFNRVISHRWIRWS